MSIIRRTIVTASDWREWLHGLVSGFIQGGAVAVSGWVGTAVGSTVTDSIEAMDWKQAGVLFLTTGVLRVLQYLSTKPLPDGTEVDETKTETVTIPPAP